MDEFWLNQPESIIQFIWKHQFLENFNLRTVDGEKVSVLEPGLLNQTDGPDFKYSSLLIDDIHWCGSVEIHINESDWFNHKHHLDPAYNNCIAHVFLHPGRRAICDNGSAPFHITLLPYLSDQILPFLFARYQHGIPCQSFISSIRPEIFGNQLDKALREYFEIKTDLIYSYFDSNELPSLAWKKAMCLAIWEGLGIQHNKAQMVKASAEVNKHFFEGQDFEDFKKLSEEAITKLILNRSIKWNYKSVRPSNHPEQRCRLGIELSYVILSEDLDFFIHQQPMKSWQKLLDKSGVVRPTNRLKKIYNLYYLPALFVLGSLMFAERLKNHAFAEWKTAKLVLPKKITEPFKKAGIDDINQLSHPGLYNQWKSYCSQSGCSSCFVFKNVIES